jgi:nucleotide-binding universal stress UspA family protein
MQGVRERGRSAPEIARQMEMRNWAQPLKLPPSRMVFQVLPGEPVATLLGYARRHLIDHIIIGARGSSALRRHLGSVSAAVAAQAECTVTVVRTRRDR